MKKSRSPNSRGFDRNHDTFKSGLGTELIDALIQQLDAKYTVDSMDGYQINVQFKAEMVN